MGTRRSTTARGSRLRLERDVELAAPRPVGQAGAREQVVAAPEAQRARRDGVDVDRDAQLPQRRLEHGPHGVALPHDQPHASARRRPRARSTSARTSSPVDRLAVDAQAGQRPGRIARERQRPPPRARRPCPRAPAAKSSAARVRVAADTQRATASPPASITPPASIRHPGRPHQRMAPFALPLAERKRFRCGLVRYTDEGLSPVPHPIPAGRRLLLPGRRGARRTSRIRSSARRSPGRYLIEGVIGEGGMATVYRATPQARRPAVRGEGHEPGHGERTPPCASASGARPRAPSRSRTRTSSRSSTRARRPRARRTSSWSCSRARRSRELIDAGPDAAAARGAHHDPDRPRHRARARPRRRAPRPQAGEHLHLPPRRRLRPREDPRLRHRALARRHAPDQRRGALRHAAVPGARAHHGRRGRAQRGPLRARGHLLRDARRASCPSRRAIRRPSSSST